MLLNEECDCHCHSNKIKHIMACCCTCSFCHKRIGLVHLESHIKRCQDKYDPLINGTRSSELLRALQVLQFAQIDTTSASAHFGNLLSKHMEESKKKLEED